MGPKTGRSCRTDETVGFVGPITDRLCWTDTRLTLLDWCPPNTALPPKPNSVLKLRLGGCWTIVVVGGWLVDLVVVKIRKLTKLFGLGIGLLVLVHLGLEFFYTLEVKTALVRYNRFDLHE